MENKPYIVNTNKVLAIPDIHQNLFYVQEILRREKNNYDHIIFLGDWFDSYYEPPVINSVSETAEFLVKCINGEYGPATFLMGNHDMSYRECWKANQNYQTPRYFKYGCSGFTKNKSLKINKILKLEDWKKFQLFCKFDNYVFSHAGISKLFWNSTISVEENLDHLWKQTQLALEEINTTHISSAYLSAGIGRNGNQISGGLNWLDWDCEFFDDIPIQQIVGHTTQYNTYRKTGNSYCIDGMQSVYAILDKNNSKIEFKTIDKHGNPPNFRDDTDHKHRISEMFKY